MKRNMFWVFCLLALTILIPVGCTTTKNTGVAIKEGATEAGEKVGETAEKAGKKVEDASITSAIKMKLVNDELVSASNINVDTDHGNVTLNGIVHSQAEADRAMELGRSVDGVKSIHSNLTIEPAKP